MSLFYPSWPGPPPSFLYASAFEKYQTLFLVVDVKNAWSRIPQFINGRGTVHIVFIHTSSGTSTKMAKPGEGQSISISKACLHQSTL